MHTLRIGAKPWTACALLAIGAVLVGGCAPGEDDSQATATSFEEYSQSYSDWSTKYVECARSFGADAEVTEDGAIVNAVGPGRSATGGLDAECVDQVGAAPAAPPLNQAFLGGLYELYQDQAECLRGLGYAISEAPSRQEWVENYSGDSWEPMSQLVGQGQNTAEAFAQCPQPDPREAERVGASLAATPNP